MASSKVQKSKKVAKSYPVATGVTGTATLLWVAKLVGLDLPTEVALELIIIGTPLWAFISRRTMQENLSE